MPLPSSGTLSLNQIHIEVGGSSGSQCSLGDSDISSLIGYGTSQQKSISNYYGASAGPSLQYTTYGTTYVAPATGKNAQPAGIQFVNTQAANIMSAMWSGTNVGGSFTINDYGYYTSSGYQGQGINLMDGNLIVVSSLGGSFNKPHGTGSGQHYIRVYYGSSLQFQSTSQTDLNNTIGPTMGNTSTGSLNIASKSSAGSWRIEYYG